MPIYHSHIIPSLALQAYEAKKKWVTVVLVIAGLGDDRGQQRGPFILGTDFE